MARDKENTLIMELKSGPVVIALRPDLAPGHVARYKELTRRVNEGFGKFDADSARELMTRPVCMNSNIHSVLFAPDTLDFWVANSDGDKPASHTRYTKYNLAELIKFEPAPPAPPEN